jgi:WS/DGAT/MGAT family acyltransferase
MRQLTGQDASFLYLESKGAHLHLTALYVFDRSTVSGGSLEFEDIVAYVASRLHTSDVFRQKLVSLPLSLDYPYWVDDERFDIRNHMHHCRLPEPGDWHELAALVGEIHSRRLDLDIPPWEMHIVDGLDDVEGIPQDGFAIIARYHHAAIDGVSGTEILSGLLDPTCDHVADPEPRPWSAEHPPGLIGMLNRAAVHGLAAPFELARAATASLTGLGHILTGDGADVDVRSESVPRTRFNAPVSPHRVFDAVRFDLAELAAFRKAVPGATVNDVVLAVCGGALREYLSANDELPGESLVAMAPINTRVPGEEGVVGNVLATMFVPIHTDIRDPLARLRAIKRATTAAKKPGKTSGSRQMAELVRHIPAPTQAIAGRLVTALGLGYKGLRLCNCTVTNIPGPRKPLYLNGARLVLSTGAGPVIDGMGLIISVFSYAGDIVFSFTGCREITPDPEFLCACARNAVGALRDSIRKSGVTPSTG